MRLCRVVTSFSFFAFVLSAGSADLSFRSAGDGFFPFDTGLVRGSLQANDASQGIPSFVDVQTGAELAYGGGNPGILSYYRIFSADKRWGDTARTWPKSAKRLPDGAVQIHWPAQPDHPFEMTATYRWKSADTLDLETAVKPEIDMQSFEVFLSSYFNKNFRSFVYVKAPRHAPGEPGFISADVSPLFAGTYLAFPRDRRSAQILYDARWEFEPNPVQFSVTRFFAAPLCMKQDAKNDITFVIMSRPEDCFAIETPYNMDPPDGIAGHYSLYLSLFGGDLPAGRKVSAQTRLRIGRNILGEHAVDLYEKFMAEHSY